MRARRAPMAVLWGLGRDNLMGTKKYDTKQQAAIARGWASSGVSQEVWANQHGISGRTLRLYLRRHCPARHWDDEIQAVVTKANEALTAILVAMKTPTATSKPFSFDDE